MSRRLKYMGSADVKVVPAGWDDAGMLAPELALKKDLVWDADNKWILEVDLDDDVVDSLVSTDDFRDVTSMKRMPASLGDKLWRGATGRTLKDSDDVTTPDTGEGAVNPSGAAETPSGTSTSLGDGGGSGSAGAAVSSATTPGAGAPTHGGSGSD